MLSKLLPTAIKSGASVENNLPLFTDLHLARAFVRALCGLKMKDLKIKAYNEYEF